MRRRVHSVWCALSVATILVACGSSPTPHDLTEVDPPPDLQVAVQEALFEYAMRLLAMRGDADAESFADFAREYSRQHSGDDNQQLHRFEDRLRWSPFANRESQPPRSPSWHWGPNVQAPDLAAASAQAQSLIQDGDFDGAFAVLYVALAAHENEAPDGQCAEYATRLYEQLQSLHQRPQPTAPYHHQVVVRLEASVMDELLTPCEELLRPLDYPDLVELHRDETHVLLLVRRLQRSEARALQRFFETLERALRTADSTPVTLLTPSSYQYDPTQPITTR